MQGGRETPDSICESMLGVNPAFSASWRCWSVRSARSALIRSPSEITLPPDPARRRSARSTYTRVIFLRYGWVKSVLSSGFDGRLARSAVVVMTWG